MAHFSSTQYNSISKEYDAVNDLPISRAILPNVERVLSPYVKGAKVLELACGTGFFTRHLLDSGVSSIVGIDISQGMIDLAQAQLSDHPGFPKCSFQLADCSQPFDVGAEQFDFVFAAWLLNYSEDEGMMTGTFRNISNHLKPNGRLVTVLPHTEEDPLVSDCCTDLDRFVVQLTGYRCVSIISTPLSIQNTVIISSQGRSWRLVIMFRCASAQIQRSNLETIISQKACTRRRQRLVA